MQNFIPGCKVLSHWLLLFYMGNTVINLCLFYQLYRKHTVKVQRYNRLRKTGREREREREGEGEGERERERAQEGTEAA
jgi:hypothetical protein